MKRRRLNCRQGRSTIEIPVGPSSEPGITRPPHSLSGAAAECYGPPSSVGLSTRAAARRFAIGVSTAGAWYGRWQASGDLRPGRQGQPKGSKLDAHAGFILDVVEAEKDIALYEIADRLAAERGVKVCPSTDWHFFDRRAITLKIRRRMPLSSSDPT